MSNTLRIALAGAAALVIAVVGIGLYFNQPGGIGPPAPSPSPSPTPTAVEIAEAYISARNAYDAERAKELVADNFTTSEPDERFRDLASLEGAFELHKAFGFQYSDGDCSQQSATGDRAVVVCDYLWTTEVHRISGQPPTPAHFTFRFRDGRISAVTHDASSDFYFGEGSFYHGFLAEHLEYRDLLDDAELYSEEYRATLELLPEYFELYEEWLSQQP